MQKSSISISRPPATAESKQDVLNFEAGKKQRMLQKLQTESENLSIILSFPSQIQKISDLESQISELQEKCVHEEQYTKVLQNLQKRVLASNKEYKIKVESLQRLEQHLLNKLNRGKEVIFEAVSNSEEDKHKVKYMRSSLTAVRSSRKHEIDKQLLKAQKTANQIYASSQVNDNPTNNISAEETKILEQNKEILKKLTRISIGTEKRKKEIDENFSNLNNLFRILGMPDLNDCLNEYEQVVITNNSLSRKTDVLLKEISQIEKQIKRLKGENMFNYRKNQESVRIHEGLSKKKGGIGQDSKDDYGLKYSELYYNTFELFRNLNGKLVKLASGVEGKDGAGFEIFDELSSNFIKVEAKVRKQFEEKKNFDEELEVVNGHVYINRKEPSKISVNSIEPDLMYTENKHGYIADLQFSANQVEKEAKKIMKNLQRDKQRDLTPLVNNDQVELTNENHSSEIEKVHSFNQNSKQALSPTFLEKNFENNLKRVSSQNLLFRKKKQVNPKNAKFYCQDMLIQKRKWSQTPRSVIGKLTSPLTQSMNSAKNLEKKLPLFKPSTPRALNNVHSAEHFSRLKKIYRF